MSEDTRRKKPCYWSSTPGTILLAPDGEPLLIEVDPEDEALFVYDPEDGERTYLIFS